MVIGMENSSIQRPGELCSGCMKGRQAATISRVPSPRVSIFLHRIHVDLVGPLPTGLRGNQYFLSIKDEAMLLAFIYPIKSKDETHDKIKEFKAKYENLTEKRLKVIRAD